MKCTRCKVVLNPSVVPIGNCQPNCHFRFSQAMSSSPQVVFHGLAAKLEWEAFMCDACLTSLTDWLLDGDWQYKETGQEPPEEEIRKHGGRP